ncbi:MAG: beta-ketoacyl synthase N-terminal-like domain-containing protein, partial [Bacteroidales bacterium]
MSTVYVTGAGTVSAIGRDLSENIQSLKNGLSGLGKVRHFETSLDVPVGEVPQDNASLQKTLVPKRAVRMSRTSLLGIQASVEAVCDCLNRGARLSDKRIGLISGTSVGGM